MQAKNCCVTRDFDLGSSTPILCDEKKFRKNHNKRYLLQNIPRQLELPTGNCLTTNTIFYPQFEVTLLHLKSTQHPNIHMNRNFMKNTYTILLAFRIWFPAFVCIQNTHLYQPCIRSIRLICTNIFLSLLAYFYDRHGVTLPIL